MNTLLGEIAKLDDVVYARYRLAFKMRKLQQTFMLDRVDIPMVKEALHSGGVDLLGSSDAVSASRLLSVLGELYESLRRRMQVKHTTVQLQEAHTTCLNWVMAAFECANGMLTAGALKIFFCLFCGGKLSEKAKYLFGVLAATGDGGNVGRNELQFFCDSVEMMGACLEEVIYTSHQTANRAISECLYFVREEEDIEDEEDYGGLQRPWVSLFEFTKVFCASPALNFFSWIQLWYSLPAMEKVAHPIKCTVCGAKNMTGFRYHCTECHFSMCEMCFLKGRISEPHKMEHKVLECMDYSKSFKSRFSLSKTNCHSKDCHVMNEPCSTKDAEYPDGSMTSLVSSNSSKFTDRFSTQTPEHSGHVPTIIRIGSASSSKPGRNSIHRNSISSNASTDSHGSSYIERASSPSIGETGQRRAAPIIPSIRRRAFSTGRFSSMRCRGQIGFAGAREQSPPNSLEHILLHRVSSDSRMPSKDHVDHEFAQINKQLNTEVDMMMKDLLPELKDLSSDIDSSSIHLKAAANQEATQQREKVTEEVDVLLEQIQNMHHGFVSMKNAGRKPRTHTRYNSLGVSPLHSSMQSSSQKELMHRFPSGSNLHNHTAMVY